MCKNVYLNVFCARSRCRRSVFVAFQYPMWQIAVPQQFDGTSEMFLQLLFGNFRACMVMQGGVHACHVFHVLEDCADIMAHDDDGTVLIDDLEGFVHLFLKTLIDVGIGFVEYHDFRL